MQATSKTACAGKRLAFRSVAYQPPPELLERYARVLVDFALSGGKGINRGDVVWSRPATTRSRSTSPFATRSSAPAAPSSATTPRPAPTAPRSSSASLEQLLTFHRDYYRGLARPRPPDLDPLDGDPHELDGVDPRSSWPGASRSGRTATGWRRRRRKAATAGRSRSTGRPAMAKEARTVARGVLGRDREELLPRRPRSDPALARDVPRDRADQAPARRARDRGAARRERRRSTSASRSARPALARRQRPEHPELRDLHVARLAGHRGHRRLHRAAAPLRRPARGDPPALRARPGRRRERPKRGEKLLQAMLASDEGSNARRRDLAHRRPHQPDHALHGRDALRRESRRPGGQLPPRARQRLP